MEQLRDCRVFLSGASSGIGKALALELAREGSKLFLTGRNKARLSATVKVCAAAGAYVRSGSLELKNEPSIRKAAAAGLKALGGIDILINNAGGEFAWGPVSEQDPEIARRQMEANYLGTLGLSRALLPEMLAQSSGLIVNVASLTGVVPTAGMATYGASKFALYGLSRALDGELKPQGVRVLCVLPPNADTPMLGKTRLPGYPKAVSPEQTARAIVLGIKRRKERIWVGLAGPLAFLYRLAPGFVEAQLARKFLSR